MANVPFLRIGKLVGKGHILVAAKHNLREILAEIGGEAGGRIDPNRCKLNYILRGPDTAVNVSRLAQEMMDEAGAKILRKDQVRGLEVIFSLPPTSTINHREFFVDALAWCDSYFQVPTLSAVVHLDEAAPHCHVLLLPLVGGRLIGSDLMGGPAKLKAMHASFYDAVGKRYGLARQSAEKPVSTALRRQAATLALQAIRSNHGLLNKQDVAQALIEALSVSPESVLNTLGIEMPVVATRAKTSFVKVMTRPVKPETL